ncbi:condensation domain-containing protein [Mycobacterium sp.]|uniref:condensation domain-containing protein n=1 Tax=Mycobacterium sp. TaxID=1785 RepID=UPI00127FF861|nr:condensation domain-containing protein [Mycobacterium sp.]KAA8959412.1 MAG: acyltransferase [Mycobacterium sp.]
MFKVGKMDVATIHDWTPEPGSVVSWHPSPRTIEQIRQAPVNAVPAGFNQIQHMRDYRAYAAQGVDMSRLVIAAWNIPGRCDIRTMTYVINAHLRRHDTYHSWFEHTDGDRFVRHTIDQARNIELVPSDYGEMTATEWRRHLLATPDPLHWDCFRFSIIQRADHFTFCVCMDHLYIDAMFFGVTFTEIHMMYAILVGGGAPAALPPAGSYRDYCLRQHQHASALTLNSPEVRAWIAFLENNDGTLPAWPLPLGDPMTPCDLLCVRIMDERQTAEFESACTAVGARFCGGVFACVALAEYELTGADTYHGIIPIDIRRTPADFMTTGWFTGYVPLSVSVRGSFADIARAAQQSYDKGRDMANVPIDRVLELAPWLRKPDWGAPLLFFLDAGMPPLSAFVNAQLDGLAGGLYNDGGILLGQINVRVNRLANETQLTVLFPNNPIARESVTRYIEALRSVFARVARKRYAVTPLDTTLASI